MKPALLLANSPAITVYILYTWKPGSNFASSGMPSLGSPSTLSHLGIVCFMDHTICWAHGEACPLTKKFLSQEAYMSGWCLSLESSQQVMSSHFWFGREGFNYIIIQIQYSKISAGPACKFSYCRDGVICGRARIHIRTTCVNENRNFDHWHVLGGFREVFAIYFSMKVLLFGIPRNHLCLCVCKSGWQYNLPFKLGHFWEWR